VAGSAIADGATLDKLVKQVVAEVAKSDPKIGQMIKLDVENVEGVRFHAINVPTPATEAEPFFGETLDIVLGIANDKLFIAVGRNAANTLKETIVQSKANGSKVVLPLQVSLDLGQIAKFVAVVADDEDVKTKAAAFADAMDEVDGKDHLTLTSTPIPNGIRVRLEAEEGILKVVGSMGEMMSHGGDAEEPADKDGEMKDDKAADKEEKPGDEK
jgi:hypothetical protein